MGKVQNCQRPSITNAEILSTSVMVLLSGLGVSSVEALLSAARKIPFLPNANLEDVAKGTIVGNLLENRAEFPDLVQLLHGFESHFQNAKNGIQHVATYCHVLNAILTSGNAVSHKPHINQIYNFLCSTLVSTSVLALEGSIVPEFEIIWSVSQSLVRLLKLWDESSIEDLSGDITKSSITLVLFQALMYTLWKQNENGSWGVEPSHEASAYAILSLKNLSSLPFLGGVKTQIDVAIQNGHLYMQSRKADNLVQRNESCPASDTPTCIVDSYFQTAVEIDYPRYKFGPAMIELMDIPEKGLQRYSRFFSMLPCAKGTAPWKIEAAIIEGYLFLPQLKALRIDMFDRAGLKEDGYVDFIAMTFAIAKTLQPSSYISTGIHLEMMILTLRAYQIDEYVEHVIAKKFSKSLEDVKAVIHEILQDDIQENRRPLKRRVLTRSEFSGVREKLRTFAERILLHPLVTSATRYEQSLLKSELRDYLLAHIAQIEDSEQYFTKKIAPNGSFHTWVRTTGSSHVFVTFSLAYLQCLVKPSSNRPVTAEELYIIHDIWTHLAKKVRMENDRPSLQRDRKEKNLNSLDFPEFPEDASVAKNQITNIILYEKRRCDMAFKELEKVGNGHQVLDVLRFYYVLTDVCGDVYTLRDISTEA